MLSISNDEIIRHRQIWESKKDYYDEKSRRLLAAAMAKSFDHGGDEQMSGLNLDKDEFHGEWNYTIVPNNSK